MMFRALLVASLVFAAPAHAGQSAATTRISGVVPPSCSLSVVRSTATLRTVVFKVRRTCNTPHVISLHGAPGGATILFNDLAVDMTSGLSILRQPGYFDGTDTVVLRSSGPGNAEDYARSLHIEIAVG